MSSIWRYFFGDDTHKVKFGVRRLVMFLLCTVLFLLVWSIPPAFLGLPADFPVTQQRVVALFIFAALLWISEPIPAWVTSITVLVLMLLTVSDSGFSFFRDTSNPNLGVLMNYKTLLHTFADPIIMLFMGGFVLAMAASHVGLDVAVARVLLKPFGTKSENVLLAFILITGLFSMFISNTATAALMITILTPVLKTLPKDGKGRIALALAIPAGANLGGLGTPIGTPPNAIALKYLNDPAGLNLNIGFGEWVAYMMPLTFLLLFLSWLLLKRLFPFKQKTIHLVIEGDLKKGWKTRVVQITFFITILLWMFDKFTGIQAGVVALIPIAIFSLFGVINKHDLGKINWSVLWMVAGGFALGEGMRETGLAQTLVSSIPFSAWPAFVVIIASGIICWILSTFISNTATAALLMPILATVSTGMTVTLLPFGGEKTLLIGIALAASLAMMLPVSTPPNAIAHSTGFIQVRHMEIFGLLIGGIGLLIGYIALVLYGTLLW
ncbi:MAG: DASS family sodium-coupled anion symporter [Bacteroides sp.]